jgi:hypothetical protein
MKSKSFPLVVCLLAGVVAVPTASAGQSQGPQEPAPASVRRPYRGLFGAPADPSSKQSLDFSASAFGAYDDDVYGTESGGIGSAGAVRSGAFVGARAGLSYEKRGDRLSGALSGGAGIDRYFDNSFDPTEYFQTAGALSAALSRYIRLSASQTLSYSPQYFLSPLLPASTTAAVGDALVPTRTDIGLFDQRAFRSATDVQVTRSFGRRSSLDASYGLALVHYTGSVTQPDYRSDLARIGFRRQLTSHAGLRAGYGYQTARYVDALEPSQQHLHNIDLGIDYGRALSISRRTHFGFSTGSAIWMRGDRRPAATEDLTVSLIGTAHLDHEMGRTWTARLGYDRSFAFYEGFTDPFLADGVTADVSGFVSRRLRFSSAASYSVGTVGTGEQHGFDSTFATAGLEFGLTRSLALFTRYVYYHYNFDGNFSNDPRLLRRMDRQGARAGLTVSVPVIR